MNWNEAKILVKYASKTRPEKFFQGLDSIVTNLAQPDKCAVVCSFDSDDDTMNQEWVKEKLTTYPITMIIHRGVSKNKIDAVNRDMNHLHDCSVIICMSDDMRFIEKGFDDTIRNDFATHFPDGDGCLHYPDQHQGERCMTLNITDSRYFNRFGYIYHNDYSSVECDLENQEVAIMLGRYKYVEKRIFNHLHPSFGDTDYDNQYRKTEAFEIHEADKATRKRRKANNYDLIKTETGWNTPPRKVHMTFPNQLTSSDQEFWDSHHANAITNQEPQMETKTSLPMSVTDLMQNSKKTIALKSKMDKKIADAQSLAAEINALGIVKIEVSVTEESLK